MQKNLSQLLELLIKTILVTSAGVVCVALLTRFVGPLGLSVTQTSTMKQATFDATGKAEMVVVPDEAKISVGITAQETTVAQAQQKVNKVINDITESLSKLEIDKKDIKTQNYSIYPDYDYEPRGLNKISGYNANVSLSITVRDFEKVNQIIDTATANGANTVGGVSFNISDEKNKELKNAARAEAIKDAQENAKKLASLAGMKLGKVVNIIEVEPNNGPLYREMAKSALPMASGVAEDTQVEPGSETYEYSVILSYETL
ncbi:MAG: SIMPL domain-containing protein [Patescibacteria group bacterium]